MNITKRFDKSAFIYKSPTEFRKHFPGLFSERAELPGKKKQAVFITSTEALTSAGLPEELHARVLKECRCTRIFNTDVICLKSEDCSRAYYITIVTKTYDVFERQTYKSLYSVLNIEQVTYNAYDISIYGYFLDKCVEHGQHGWDLKKHHMIEHLYYEGRKKDV